MPLGVEERTAVVACDDLGVGEPARARAADMRERSGRNVKDLPPGTKPAREVDVLEPELELLVPAADRLERVAADEQTGPRRLIHGDDGVLVQLQRRPRPSEQRAGECERTGKRARQVLLLRPAVVGVDEPPRGGDGVRPLLSSASASSAIALSVANTSSFRNRTSCGAPGLGAAVVGEREPLGLLDADDLRACRATPRPSRPPSRCRPRSRARAAASRRCSTHSSTSSRESRVATTASITAVSYHHRPWSGLDANLRSGPQMLQYQRSPATSWPAKPRPRRSTGVAATGRSRRSSASAGIDVVPFDYREDLAAPTVEPLERFPEIEAHLSPDPVALPFDDGSFDTVLSCGVLEHVQDPDGSLDEMAGVLRPGGMFYVTNLPNRYSYTERWPGCSAATTTGSSRTTASTPSGRRAPGRAPRLQRRGVRRVHMLPLALGGPARPIWMVSSALERIPGLNVVATSLEIVAYADA